MNRLKNLDEHNPSISHLRLIFFFFFGWEINHWHRNLFNFSTKIKLDKCCKIIQQLTYLDSICASTLI